MKIKSDNYRVKPDDKVDLADWPTRVEPVFESKQQYQEILTEHVHSLSSRQEILYACNKYALLIVFQAMDAAGKDGSIRHVMSGVNPQGCEVFSFKQPSTIELQHDFLWRASLCLPERGKIGIFNRSYYEDVLVVKVHPELLHVQGYSKELIDSKEFWEDRYHSIREYEKHLYRNGTRIVKIYLHVSNEEQRKRFLARIDDPNKNWKFSLADVRERKFWKNYMAAYGACLSETSTRHAPWYVVPADDKENARLIVSQIVLDAIDDLDIAFPETTAEHRQELESIRKEL